MAHSTVNRSSVFPKATLAVLSDRSENMYKRRECLGSAGVRLIGSIERSKSRKFEWNETKRCRNGFCDGDSSESSSSASHNGQYFFSQRWRNSGIDPIEFLFFS